MRFSVTAGSAQDCLQDAEQYVRSVLGPGATEPWLKTSELKASTPVEYTAEITYAFFNHDDSPTSGHEDDESEGHDAAGSDFRPPP